MERLRNAEMGMTSRNKGKAGERAVANILRDHLGVAVHRNWMGQAAQGGSDLAGLDAWSIEVKLCARVDTGDWWHQAQEQAARENKAPVLIWRQSGAGRGLPDEWKWQARVIPESVGLEARGHLDMPLLTWMDLVRDSIEECQ